MRWLDEALSRLVSLASWLLPPLSLLLFLQWPLRDVVRAYSREANDLAQILFALYVAVAITAATRKGVHIVVDVVASRYAARSRRILMAAALVLGLVPWCIFVALTGRSLVWTSLVQREAFSDTSNPGYFLVKGAAAILVVTMLLQAGVDLVRLGRAGPSATPPPDP